MEILKRSFERRDFLRGVAGLSVASSYPLFLRRAAAAAMESAEKSNDATGDRILVVLQLSGGNDGLSTVVPYADDDYHRARRTARIEEKDALKIDERVGLHPALGGLKELYDRGEFAIVQGTSYPNPTRSHFLSMDVWHAADRDGARVGTGWLGRALDSCCGNQQNPLLSVNIGGKLPLALAAEKVKPITFQNPQSYQWNGRSGNKDAFGDLQKMKKRGEKGVARSGKLDFLLRVSADARSSSETIRKTLAGYRPTARYPNGRLAADLRTVSAMISSGLPTRIYYVSLGGFDTHANQKQRHDRLMATLSQSVGAFMSDLRKQKLLDRVAILSFSEFGRRVKENGSRGTDHGVAGPMFLFGSKIRGGLHGEHPSLTELDKGDLVMTTDFRSVYATLLDDWLGVSSKEVLGGEFERLPLFGKRRRTQVF